MISAEFNKILHIFITSFNLLICFIMLILFYWAAKKPNNLSKELKIYFAFCLDPFGLLLILLSVITGIYSFFFSDTEILHYRIFRILLVFCSLQIRYSYFFIVLSRIVATIFYKEYSKYSNNTQSVTITILITYAVSLLNGYLEFIRVFVDMNQFYFTIYIGLSQHLITLILCKVLHKINKKKYETLAYQSSLAERHQIYKNVKLLKSIWPIILIFSTISPLGPLSVLFYKYVLGYNSPTALYYSFYNLAFLIVICWKLALPNDDLHNINIIGKDAVQVATVNCRGKVQPEVIPVERYFTNLEKQWK